MTGGSEVAGRPAARVTVRRPPPDAPLAAEEPAAGSRPTPSRLARPPCPPPRLEGLGLHADKAPSVRGSRLCPSWASTPVTNHGPAARYPRRALRSESDWAT